MRNPKNITDRKQLKAFFKKGNLPTESAFAKLIDSTFNIAEDKLDINEDGLMIYPSENGKEKLLSFFEDRDAEKATWAMYTSKKPTKGISINQIVQDKQDDDSILESVKSPAIFIQKDDGKIGMGTNTPIQQLDVRGIIASNGRVGNYHEGNKPADGEWHNVFDKPLEGCNAYEIMAYSYDNKTGEGKSSMLHAIVISTSGNSKPRISKTIAHNGGRWNKIAIRWESRPTMIIEKPGIAKKKIIDIPKWWKKIKDFIFRERKGSQYNLQLKTMSNYGKGKIEFKVSVLWDFPKPSK